MASPSSSVVCNAWVTWYSELLATMHTAGVPASIRLRNVASSSTLPRGRRVDPKATSVLVVRVQLAAGPGEELDVLRVGARPAAFDVVHAEEVELLGDAQLVLHCRRDTLDLEAVAERGVEHLNRLNHDVAPVRPAPRTEEAARRAAPACTWMVHVHYEMMMIAARRVASGEITAPIQSVVSARRQTGSPERRPPPRGNLTGEVG